MQQVLPKMLNHVKIEKWFRTSSMELSPSFNFCEKRTIGNVFYIPSIFWILCILLTHEYSIITRLFQKFESLKS